MNIKIVGDDIKLEEAKEIGKEFYDDMVKGAIDIKLGIVVIGGEYHIDASNVLVQNGSKQSDIWGFNIVFTKDGKYFLEYTAMINIKPVLGNRDMEIQDQEIKDKILEVVSGKLKI